MSLYTPNSNAESFKHCECRNAKELIQLIRSDAIEFVEASWPDDMGLWYSTTIRSHEVSLQNLVEGIRFYDQILMVDSASARLDLTKKSKTILVRCASLSRPISQNKQQQQQSSSSNKYSTSSTASSVAVQPLALNRSSSSTSLSSSSSSLSSSPTLSPMMMMTTNNQQQQHHYQQYSPRSATSSDDHYYHQQNNPYESDSNDEDYDELSSSSCEETGDGEVYRSPSMPTSKLSYLINESERSRKKQKTTTTNNNNNNNINSNNNNFNYNNSNQKKKQLNINIQATTTTATSPPPPPPQQLPSSPLVGYGSDYLDPPSSPISSSSSTPSTTTDPSSTPTSLGKRKDVDWVELPKNRVELVPDLSNPMVTLAMDKCYSESAGSVPNSELSIDNTERLIIEGQIQLPPLLRPRQYHACKIPKEDRPSKRRKNHTTLFCRHCGTNDTPEWRRGPDGRKSLCNACGLHYSKTVKRENMTPQAQTKRFDITNLLNPCDV